MQSRTIDSGEATPSEGSEPSPDPAPATGQSTYGQILKSSALVGGSSLLNVAAGIVRSKVFALVLGPAGFGLMGLYWSIVNLAEIIAGMGVNSAGVRQIAAAAGSGETGHIARTAAILRRSSLALGLLGALLLVGLAGPVAKLTFGGYDRTLPVALLSLAVLFRTVSAGQGALIQGLRRIADLARCGVIGGLLGTAASIVLVYAFREQGVVPSIIAVEGMSLVLSWWYSRKISLDRPTLSPPLVRQEVGDLLKLGFAFMASGMLTMGAAYGVRIIIVRQIGIAAAGYYQSAWTVGGLYVGFILGAMGADFFPRLTAAVHDDAECNRLVNEQTEISLLLAGPGLLATLTFAPLVVPLFYSAAFLEAVELLRWLCVGVALRVVTWPMGFIILAHARRRTFILVDLAYTIAYLALAWTAVRSMGLNGSGIAFFASYVVHGLIVYPVVRSLSGFRWSAANWQIGGRLLVLLVVAFGGFYLLPPWLAAVTGTVVVLASTLYSAKRLAQLVPAERLPRVLQRWGQHRP